MSSQELHPPLERALAEHYAAFRRPTPSNVDGCPCCTDPAKLKALVRTALRDLTANQLEFYAHSALFTVGSVTDLRYFWPRLAELSIRGELLTDAEILFEKPRLGEWRTWPAVEQDALVNVARAQLESLAERHHASGRTIDRWVCAFGRFLDDVTIVLAPLLRDEPDAAAALLGWYSLNENELSRGGLSNAFWESAPENAARVMTWLSLPATVAAIERARECAGAWRSEQGHP